VGAWRHKSMYLRGHTVVVCRTAYAVGGDGYLSPQPGGGDAAYCEGHPDFVWDAEEVTEPGAVYTDLSYQELRALVKERGLEPDSNKREDLIEALLDADEEEEVDG